MIAPRTKGLLWRFGAIGLFCGMPVLLLGLAVSNVVDATQANEQAARKRANASTIVAQLEKHRARVTTPVDTASLYLASTSDTLARAELQDRATKLVTQAGGRLAEVQLTATPEQEAAGTVAIQLSLDIDNKGLLDLLYAIESGLPLFDVTDLNAAKGSGRDDEQRSNDQPIHVEMTVQAHWRKGTG